MNLLRIRWSISSGVQVEVKNILKVIEYKPIEREGNTYYNFGFGDLLLNPVTGQYDGKVDDTIESNNGDVVKVFYTVVSTLTGFFKRHPKDVVHIEGSNRQRMDVYEKLIVRHWKEIEPIYNIRGVRNKKLEEFRPNTQYSYILISLAKSVTL